MKTKKLRELSVEALREEIFQAGREQFNLKMQRATRQLAAVHRLKAVRRRLAQLLTILHEKIGLKV